MPTGEVDVNIMRVVMRAIFGTNTRCRETERHAADEMLARVEDKVEKLNKELNGRQARNLDEAIRQVSKSER